MAIVTNAGLDALAYILVDTFAYMATGTGTTTESPIDTTLESENTLYGSARKLSTTTYSSDGSGTSTWNAFFVFTDTVVVREYGIFSNDYGVSGDVMLYRCVLAANRTYGDGESLEITVTHSFGRA